MSGSKDRRDGRGRNTGGNTPSGRTADGSGGNPARKPGSGQQGPSRNRSEHPAKKTRSDGKQRADRGRRSPAKPPRAEEPQLPEGTNGARLDGAIRRELRALPKELADKVAVHLVAAGELIDSDPQRALTHARYARRRASRVAPTREANGLTAYQAGEWNEALGELRAARRIGGTTAHLPVLADCERALGRPRRALELSRTEEAAELDRAEAIELRIVAAGARRDLGEVKASVVTLQIPELDPRRQDGWSARLFYAYADNLLVAGRTHEAFTWFVHAAHADDEGETDAAERLEEFDPETAEPPAWEAGAR